MGAVCGSSLTLAKCSAVIHTLVIVFVLCAEVGVVVIAQGVPSVAAVVGNEELVAVQLIADGEKAVLSVASLSSPILRVRGNISIQQLVITMI